MWHGEQYLYCSPCLFYVSCLKISFILVGGIKPNTQVSGSATFGIVPMRLVCTSIAIPFVTSSLSVSHKRHEAVFAAVPHCILPNNYPDNCTEILLNYLSRTM